LHDVRPVVIACDLHPDYISAKHAYDLANSRSLPLARIQHHSAHVISCMAENGIEPPLLGVSWDGTGYAADKTIWGGEFLQLNGESLRRVAHFRTFPLAGGDAAIKKPKQTAIGLLYEIFGERAFDGTEPPILRQMLEKSVRTPRTSSAGRLFDAVAAITGVCEEASFEGQAAMQLEFAIDPAVDDFYPYTIQSRDVLHIDWEPMIRELTSDVQNRVSAGTIAARFHNTLVEIIADVAARIGEMRVILTGGCFQNRYLTERAVRRLASTGFLPYWHQRVPPNDGGIALGQAVAADWEAQERHHLRRLAHVSGHSR
jgi:hydrogenase maturation protein HypF